MSRAKPAFLLLPLALFVAQPAAACLYSQAPEEVGDTSAQYFARHMVVAAAYVDLVLVEDDGTRALNQPATGVLTVRSIAHLKGNGADRFNLFGTGLTLSSEAERIFRAPLQHFTQEDGRVIPFPYNEEGQGQLFRNPDGPPPPPRSMTSCSPPQISGQSGRFYVVMRGEDGRLLGSFTLNGQSSPSFAFVPVTLESDDHWLRAVVSAVSTAPSPQGGESLVHLRRDADPARIQAALRRVGANAVGAFVRSGDWVDEIRPAEHETRADWLARALPMVSERNRSHLASADHSGAEFLRGKLGPEQSFGGLGYEVGQAFTASVRRRQAAKSSAPQLVALAISDSAQALAALAQESFVEGVRPASIRRQGLPLLAGETEAGRFATIQSIERDIWLLNGGNGNPQGTLPNSGVRKE